MPLIEYQSGRLHNDSNIILQSAIPGRSMIISIMVECLNAKSGSVTLQDRPEDGGIAERIVYIDYITGKGRYTGNSAKGFFESSQNLDVKIVGGLEVIVNILFWRV